MFVDEDFAIDCRRRSPLHRASSPGVLFRQIVEGTAGVAFRSGARHMTHLPAPSVPFADRQEGRLPGWLTRWWETLHPYAHYAGARPRLIFLFSPGAGWLPSAILVIAVLWISWQWCDSDLLLAIGFSVAAFQLMFPFQIYNEVLLLPAVLWLLLQRRERRRCSQLFTLLLSCLWIVLGNGWTSALGLSVVNLLYPGSAGRFIAFPLLSVWLLPYAVFLLFSSPHFLSVWILQRPAKSWNQCATHSGYAFL